MGAVPISESNLSSAMKFVFDEFFKPLDTEGLLDYRPKTQDDKKHFHDDKVTGIIYLKDHPDCKYAWILVRFDENTDRRVGSHAKYSQNDTLRSIQDFISFFGVAPDPKSFIWKPDTVIYVRSGKQIEPNTVANHDFQETAPHFYMYIDHSNVNPQVAVDRIYKISDILAVDKNAFINGTYHITSKVKNATSVKKLLDN